MKNKALSVLVILLMVALLGCFCTKKTVFSSPRFPLSSFELQQKYEQKLENKLVNLLEPAVGIGNVRTSVQAEITHQDITKTYFDFEQGVRTTVKEKGPILNGQSISVLINAKEKSKLPIYQKIIQNAVGFNSKRGDSLNIEILPFLKVPFWQLGLDPIYLARLAFVLIVFLIIGFFYLANEWIKNRSQKSSVQLYMPNEALWQKIKKISLPQLAELLKVKSPEITAFILYHLSNEKASEIIEFLPNSYMNQVALHLDYIEKLNNQDKLHLLQETEKHLREILKIAEENNSSKENTLFEELKMWNDTDLQHLLYYTSKKDLIYALQNTSLVIQQSFARNIPPALWQDLIHQIRLNPCSEYESQKAQEKIMKVAKLLKEKK